MRDRSTQRFLLGSSGNTLVMLIAVLAVTFAVFKFVQLAFMLTHADTSLASQMYERNIQQWFVFPASWELILYRPWTLLTYLFYHDGVFHLIGNLIWLWVFGFILQDLTGNKSILPLFLYGGFAGALFFALGFQFFPALQLVAHGSTRRSFCRDHGHRHGHDITGTQLSLFPNDTWRHPALGGHCTLYYH